MGRAESRTSKAGCANINAKTEVEHSRAASKSTGVSHGWFWGLYSGGTSPTIACGILLPSIRSALSP